MRIIFGIGSRLFVWESSVSKVKMKLASEAAAEDENDEEEFKSVPQDPHGTLNCHCELSPQAIFEGARATVNTPRRFGFGIETAG